MADIYQNDTKQIIDSQKDNRERLQKSMRAGLLNVKKSVDSMHTTFNKQLKVQEDQLDQAQRDAAFARENAREAAVREKTAKSQGFFKQKKEGGILSKLSNMGILDAASLANQGKMMSGTGILGSNVSAADAVATTAATGFTFKKLKDWFKGSKVGKTVSPQMSGKTQLPSTPAKSPWWKKLLKGGTGITTLLFSSDLNESEEEDVRKIVEQQKEEFNKTASPELKALSDERDALIEELKKASKEKNQAEIDRLRALIGFNSDKMYELRKTSDKLKQDDRITQEFVVEDDRGKMTEIKQVIKDRDEERDEMEKTILDKVKQEEKLIKTIKTNIKDTNKSPFAFNLDAPENQMSDEEFAKEEALRLKLKKQYEESQKKVIEKEPVVKDVNKVISQEQFNAVKKRVDEYEAMFNVYKQELEDTKEKLFAERNAKMNNFDAGTKEGAKQRKLISEEYNTKYEQAEKKYFNSLEGMRKKYGEDTFFKDRLLMKQFDKGKVTINNQGDVSSILDAGDKTKGSAVNKVSSELSGQNQIVNLSAPSIDNSNKTQVTNNNSSNINVGANANRSRKSPTVDYAYQ